MWHQISFLFFLKFFKSLSCPEDQLWTKTVWFLMCCLPLRQTHAHHLWWWMQGYGFFNGCLFFLPWAVKLLLHFIPLLFFLFFFNLHLNTKGQLQTLAWGKCKVVVVIFLISPLRQSLFFPTLLLCLHCFSSLCKTYHDLFHQPLLSSFCLAVDKS